jgi:hypothetical protein
MDRYSDKFDFFNFLDKTLKIHNCKNPVPKGIVGKEQKTSSNYAFSGGYMGSEQKYGCTADNKAQ